MVNKRLTEIQQDGEYLAQVEKEKKKPKILLIILVIMSLIIVAGTVAIFTMTDIKISDIMAKFEKHEEFILPMETYVVNLKTEDGKKKSYLKTGVSLLYDNKDYTELLTKKTSQVRDVIINSLIEYSQADLLAEGGLDNAKTKLKTNINTALELEVIKEVYFTEFIIQ